MIDRIAEKIAFFEMRVPEGVLNFDVNWKKDKKASYNITDIGFCPQIELRAGKQNVVRESEFTEVITQLRRNAL